MADRWHKLPSEVMAMDPEGLRLLEIIEQATPKRAQEGGYGGG